MTSRIVRRSAQVTLLVTALALGGCKVVEGTHWILREDPWVWGDTYSYVHYHYGQRTSGLLFAWWSICKRDRGCFRNVIEKNWSGDRGYDGLVAGARDRPDAFFAALDRIGRTDGTRCLFYGSSCTRGTSTSTRCESGWATHPAGGYCQPLCNPTEDRCAG